MVIEDAGVDPAVVNGLSTHGIAESTMFAPATLSEYLGLPLDFGDRVDLGGATAAGMVWRGAAGGGVGRCGGGVAAGAGGAEITRGGARARSTPGGGGGAGENHRYPPARVG